MCLANITLSWVGESRTEPLTLFTPIASRIGFHTVDVPVCGSRLAVGSKLVSRTC